jgi:glutathione S-transferase
MKLYDASLSADCYKARLMLSLLGLDYEPVPVDVMAGEHESEKFLALNPFGKLPVLVDGDVTLRDSHAALIFLALKHSEGNWMPTDPSGAGEVMQWLSVAANDMQHSLNEAWLVAAFNIGTDLEGAQARAKAVLDILEQHLQAREWLALGQLGRLTVADVACYPYIAVAPDGKIDLSPYTAVQAWMKRVEALPGFVRMLPN